MHESDHRAPQVAVHRQRGRCTLFPITPIAPGPEAHLGGPILSESLRGAESFTSDDPRAGPHLEDAARSSASTLMSL